MRPVNIGDKDVKRVLHVPLRCKWTVWRHNDSLKMASTLLTCIKEEQRSVLRILLSKGMKLIEIHRQINVEYGESCLSTQHVNESSMKLQNIWVLRHCSRPGQEHRVVSPEYNNTPIVRERHCDTSWHCQGSAHLIVHVVLQYHKVSERWVPQYLTPGLKQRRH